MTSFLAPPSSQSKSSLLPSSSSSSSNAFFVKLATTLLWVVFGFLDLALWSSSLLWELLNHKQRSPGKRTTKTVVIVGGNFAGLAALRELQAWQKRHSDDGKCEIGLRLVLIDQCAYSIYTPGILRLFCDPGYFSNLAQPLPETTDQDGCFLERIQGTVTSLVADDDLVGTTISTNDKTQRMKQILTYVPTATTNDETRTRNLSYDYLILATGATYTEPISPKIVKGRQPTPATATTTLLGRYKEWKNAHERLKGASRVLILGGGAVGVELAAEILDHNEEEEGCRKTVTIVDASPTLVPLFPRSVGVYAEDWLSRKGADLRLGESLRSWNDRSCTLQDGTVLRADIVYVCFGSRPNSEMVTGSSQRDGDNPLFSLTKRRNVVVKDTLQLVIPNNTDCGGYDDGDDDKFSDSVWFSCGDVASPPTNDEKQAFQAEMQGKVAAKNVIKLFESSSSPRASANHKNPSLLRYPVDIAGADRIPLVFVLSLGRYDGVLGFNSLCLPGSLAAIVKWILEHTKVSQMRGRLLGNLIWKIGDAVTLFLSRTLFPSPSAEANGGAARILKPLSTSHNSANIATIPTLSSLPPRHTPAPHQRHQHRRLEEQLKIS